eukprot:scaffold1410_cov76-Skeletonema_dohrnii-CCMP3373.AAC.2
MPATVQHIWAMAVCFAQNFDRNADPDHLIEHFYKPFHDMIVHTCLKDDGTFFQGTLYELFLESMPHAMRQIREEVEMWQGLSDDGDASRSSFFRELFVSAFTVDDGCLHAGKTGTINHGLAIKDLKGGDVHVKRYLRRHGWKDRRKHIAEDDTYCYVGLTRDITAAAKSDPYIFFANDNLLSFKKRIWETIIVFSKFTPSGCSGSVNPFYSLARKTSAIICSVFNQTHGCYLPMSFFLGDFRKMAKNPCLFDICVSGMLASDGSVGDCRIMYYQVYQSNQRFIVALATIMKEKYGVNPKVTNRKCDSIQWRPSYKIRINSKDTRKLLPRVASFDLNRADQHLVLLLRFMAKEAKGVPNRNSVKAFLRGLGKYIRKLHPS